MNHRSTASAITVLALTAAASAGQSVTFVAQQRTIAATTTADNNTVTATAPGFGPFVQTVLATAPFPTPQGTPAPNTGETGIDCEIDPNAITARGTLGAQGGINITGTPVFGEAEALVEVRFTVTDPTPWRIFSTPRPSDNPRDEFEIELENFTTGVNLFRINETQPAQTVDVTGLLQPGTYLIHYAVEFTHDGPSQVRPFDFRFQIGDTCATGDFNNDGDFSTDADIEAFFACLAGTCCPTCYTADFNGDGETGTDADIESFFRVLAGNPC